MPLFDLPLAELETYAPVLDEPADLDAFWARTLAESREAGGDRPGRCGWSAWRPASTWSWSTT